jgi:hypothetical protein
MWVITVVDAAAGVCTVALVANSENTKTMSSMLPHPHRCNPLWRVLRPAAIVDGTVTWMLTVLSFISAATDGVAIVHESDGAPTLRYPAPSRPNQEIEPAFGPLLGQRLFDLGGSVADEREARSSLQTLVASRRTANWARGSKFGRP